MGRQPPLIALVADVADVRSALARLALAAGLTAEAHASGETFLQSMDDHEPDCVVLDLHMPGLDGFAVQAALGRRGSTLPVVVITGYDQPAARRRATTNAAADGTARRVRPRATIEDGRRTPCRSSNVQEIWS